MNKIIKVIGNFEDLYHGNGASVDSIKEAEKKLKTKFSEEYYDYLCAFGTATFDGDEFTGLTDIERKDVVLVTEKYRRMFGKDFDDKYVIEETNIDGIVIWQSSTGEIFQSNMEGEIKKICDSLIEYIV